MAGTGWRNSWADPLAPRDSDQCILTGPGLEQVKGPISRKPAHCSERVYMYSLAHGPQRQQQQFE